MIEVKINQFEERLKAYIRAFGFLDMDADEFKALGVELPGFTTWSEQCAEGR